MNKLGHMLFVFVAAFVNQIVASENTLLSLHVISRHGKRTPYVTSYPSDPNQDFLRLGLGQLTEDGYEQMKEYGQTIRKLYGTFLIRDYRKILARSSHVPRCVQTGEAMISEIYPSQSLNGPNSLPQPIPIFSNAAKCDGALYNIYVDDLTGLYSAKSRFGFEQEYINKLIKDSKDLSGQNVSSSLDLLDLYDTLLCEKVHGKIIPPWVEKVYPRLEKLNEAFFLEMRQNPQHSIPIGGPLLKTVLEDLKAPPNTKGTDDTVNAFYYFTHDYMINTIMGLLNVPIYPATPFGATLLVEKNLYRNQTFIHLSYLNSSKSKPDVLTMKECDSEYGCEFEKFESLVNVHLTSTASM